MTRKEHDHSQGADEAQLFADHGVDEIRMPLGKEQEFLPSFPQTPAEHAAAAEGQEGLDDLVARALRVGPGVEERDDPPPAVRLVRDGDVHERQGRKNGAAEVEKVRAAGKEHDARHARKRHGAPEIRLKRRDAQKDRGHDVGGDQCRS